MARNYRRLTVLSALLVTLAVLQFVPSGLGQNRVLPKPAQSGIAKDGSKSEEPQYTDAVTLPRNPESKRLIQAAQDYLKKQEWRIAAECLQSLLETPEDSFIEITRKNDAGADVTLRVSVRAEANRLIGELPPEGRESYQLQYGQIAAEKLRHALELADPILLAEVSQRYLHTQSGRDATDLLGTYHLDRGQYLMASLCYERLLTRPDADQLPPKMLFKAALAFKRSGQLSAAEKMFMKLTDKLARNDLVVARTRLNLDQLRAELNRDAGIELTSGIFDWPIFRGNASRTAQTHGSTAYLEPRWVASLIKPDDPVEANDQPAVKWVEQYLEIAVQSMKDKPILPAFFPIVANHKLIVRTYDGIAAYSLKPDADGKPKAGELLWRSNADNSLFSTVRFDINGRRMALEQWYNTYYRPNNVGPLGIFFENSVLGSLSHDGQRVFFIDDLAVPPHTNMMDNYNFNGMVNNFGPFHNEVYYNRLFTADIESGKLSWSPLGGRAPSATAKPDEFTKEVRKELNAATELLDTFFLGPPLPLGGKLYLLVEKLGELRLVCLDPQKLVPSALNQKDKVPDLVWVQSLGTANKKLPLDGLRRTQAAHLSYSDGVLVCPTNSGAVLGVDLLSHSLVWAYSYRKAIANANPDEVNNRMWLRRQQMWQPTGPTSGERWRVSAPSISKGKVVFTPPDGSDAEIHCITLRDGRRAWTAKPDASSDLYLAGVYDDKVVIVAKNHVRALNLEDGKEVWRRSETGIPAGQGVAADGLYYLPLANCTDPKSSDKGPEICAIDIKTGQITGRSKSRKEPPGNLLFMDGELISQSPTMLATFPLLKVKQEEISRYLAKNPRDPTGLTERGELHLYNREVRNAVADLRTALANEPPATVRVKARTKLHEALTSLLQSDFPTAEIYLDEYEDLCKLEIPANADADLRQRLVSEQVRRRASYLELVGRGRENQGRVLDAFRAYEQYGELAGHKELVDSIDEPNTKARPDVWSRARIQALLTNAKPDDRKQLETEISTRWEKVRGAAGLEALRKFVTMYGTLPGVGQSARLEFVERLLATGDPDDLTEAERLLAVVCYGIAPHGDDAGSTVRALELMIRVCVRRGQYENAVAFCRRLAEEFPDVQVRNGLTGKQIFEDLITDKRFLPYLDTPTVVWSGPLAARKQTGNYLVRESTITLTPQGELMPFFDRHRIVLDIRLDGQPNGAMRVLDRITGEERWKVPNLPHANYLNPNTSAVMPFAFAQGYHLYLHLNHLVFAFDLAERRELWRYNLFGKDVLLNSQQNNLAFDPNLGLMVLSDQEKRVSLGRIAQVEASYVALQTANGLVVLDPSRPGPSVLWTKTDVSPKAQLFGDDRHIFVFDAEENKKSPRCLALRSQDGAPVPVADFTEFFQKKITTIGSRILLSEQGGRSLRLYDVRDSKEIWRRQFSQNSVVVRSEQSKLIGAIEPSGLFTLMDTRHGDVLFTSQLRPEDVEKLQEATMLVDHDRYYLALNRNADRTATWNSAAGYAIRSARVNGPVYALNRRTGKLEWVCDFVPHQSLLLEQWADLPVLLFATKYNKMSANGAPERQGVKVTAVAKSTGKLIFDDELPQYSDFHALNANVSIGRVELIRQDMKIVLTTPEGAARPEPVEQARPQPVRRANLQIAPAVILPVQKAPGG